MEEATTSRSGRPGSATRRSRKLAVANVFTRTYRSISYIDWPTPTAAARWTTASTPSSARSAITGSPTSPWMNDTPSGNTGLWPRCTCGSGYLRRRHRHRARQDARPDHPDEPGACHKDPLARPPTVSLGGGPRAALDERLALPQAPAEPDRVAGSSGRTGRGPGLPSSAASRSRPRTASGRSRAQSARFWTRTIAR